MTAELSQIASVLDAASSVLIASHIFPDGDAIGSTIALALALARQGKKVIAVNGDPVPHMFKYLKGSDKIILPCFVDDVPEVVVMVDCTDQDRVGDELAEKLRPAKVLINIDHHISNGLFGDYRLIKPEAAATGELIYQLLQRMHVDIDSDIATALYAALATDTGSFRYDNTSAETHRITASLLEKGVDLGQSREYLWERKPLTGLLLLEKVLATLTVTADGTVAWVTLTKEEADGLGAVNEDCEGFIEYPRSVAGVEIGMFFREIEDGLVKVGFRSKRYANVNRLAATFDGGGHLRAAGCTIKGSMDQVVREVVDAARKELTNPVENGQ
ncbi:MAG: DHH family phosphoesterase [Bacillota bacterium]